MPLKNLTMVAGIWKSLEPLFVDYATLSEQITPLTKGEMYLPWDHILHRTIPGIVGTILVTSFIYTVSFPLAADKLFSASSESFQTKRQLCYQITNVLVNLFLGVMGCYYEYFLLPETASQQERIQGNEDIFLFASIQIGYQLWSLVAGTFLVKEKTEMMFHHFSVVYISSMPGFLYNGFRYYSPFYFGIYELSSVPLGFMNVFKFNKEWMEAYPRLYGMIRLIFAICFLTIRIVMIIPRMTFIRDICLYPWLMDNTHFGIRMYLFGCAFGSLFLYVLQMYWGYLIVTGIGKALKPLMNGGKKKDKSKQQ